VTNRPYIHVRLTALEFLLGHLFLRSCFRISGFPNSISFAALGR
jgi:hypothetical protein